MSVSSPRHPHLSRPPGTQSLAAAGEPPAQGEEPLMPRQGRHSREGTRGKGRRDESGRMGRWHGPPGDRVPAGWAQLTPLAPREVHLFRSGYHVAKRALDLCVCAVIALPVFAVMALCAAAVWLGDGRPVFFVQWRTGRGGRRFRIYKFRTMVKNAEQLKQQYLHLNRMSGPEFKLADDPRVTRAGRFLRKWSLDELPQIFNVLKGEMSLVGPRPTSFDAAKYALWQTERLEVPPGITGLAQVSGRSELSFEDKLRLDLRYVEYRNFWLDLQILVRTVGVVVYNRGAY